MSSLGVDSSEGIEREKAIRTEASLRSRRSHVGFVELDARQNSFKTRGTERQRTEASGIKQMLRVERESKFPNLENEEHVRVRKQTGTERNGKQAWPSWRSLPK